MNYVPPVLNDRRGEKVRPLWLTRADVARTIEIVASTLRDDYERVRVTVGPYELETPSDVEELPPDLSFSNLSVRSSRVDVELHPYTRRLYWLSDGSPEVRLAAHDLRAIFDERRMVWRLAAMLVATFVAAVCVFLGLTLATDSPAVRIGSVFILAPVYGFVVVPWVMEHSAFRVLPADGPQTFLRRNRDALIVGSIVAIVGALLGAALG